MNKPAMATAQATKNAITLKGSATIISEYLSKRLTIATTI